jgi:hypothetical protein
MGKINNILASEPQVQKLYQCIAGDEACRDLSSDARAFALLQRDLASKAAQKLPGWAAKNCLYTRRALEQCSSETLADYKAALFGGAYCLDLSSGLGVDAVAFSRKFAQVHAYDPDEELNLLFAINMQQLGIRNINRFQGDALSALQDMQSKADLIYLDPDRRDKQGEKRLVGFQRYHPNPLEVYRLFGHLGECWLLKLSPLDDISAICEVFAGLKSIRVISKEGEVKELLLELVPDYSGATEISAVFIGAADIKSYSYFSGHSISSELIHFKSASQPQDWLYEPAAALIKSAYLKNSAHQMLALNHSGTLWTAAQKEELPGRWVKLLAVKKDFSLRKMKRFLNEQGIDSGLVKTRDFPIGSEQARSVLGISEGTQHAVYLTKTGNTTLMMLGEIIR